MQGRRIKKKRKRDAPQDERQDKKVYIMKTRSLGPCKWREVSGAYLVACALADANADSSSNLRGAAVPVLAVAEDPPPAEADAVDSIMETKFSW